MKEENLYIFYTYGITKFLSPIRGLSGSAKRQTTTWPFNTVIAA